MTVKTSGPQVVFADDDLLVVDKPGGMVCHSAQRPEFMSLADWARAQGVATPRMINRLDRETSGLVIIAKNERAAKILGKQVLRRELAKEYRAIVWGAVANERGVIDQPIALSRDAQVYTRREVQAAGQPSVTEYEVVERLGSENDSTHSPVASPSASTHSTGSGTASGSASRATSRDSALQTPPVEGGAPQRQSRAQRSPAGPGFTVLRLVLRTGRTHQLRVHLSWLGHPIVGDKVYGPDERWYLEFIEKGVTAAMLRALLLPRHALHAAAVAFTHPTSGQRQTVRAEWPDDLAEFLEAHR